MFRSRIPTHYNIIVPGGNPSLTNARVRWYHRFSSSSQMPVQQMRQMRFRPHVQPLRDPPQRHRGLRPQPLRERHFDYRIIFDDGV